MVKAYTIYNWVITGYNFITAFSFQFCSLYLFKLGIAPQIQDLLGKVDFTGKHTDPDAEQ